MRLQLRNQRSNIFYREAGLFADFVQTRRPARSRKTLKNRSPHAVLCWLKRLIPFFDEVEPRAIPPEDCLSRSTEFGAISSRPRRGPELDWP